MIEQEDTIAAIATPIGEGGLSVIRISGSSAIRLVDLRFRGKHKLSTALTHTVHHGFFYDGLNEVIDEVVATVFKQPHSYTSEDIVEISCHGGIFISKKILTEIITSGARMALPGEFTKRAFINGKIDLSQAEAVADIIKANTDLSLRTSIQQLQGKISREVGILREKVLNICSLLELELDFSEEDLGFVEKTKSLTEINGIISSIDNMISTYKVGRIYRDGAKVVIVGKPNVGKSSILNSLLNEDRSIVTDTPGTTRDVIQENIVINGVLFKIVDTAGLRESNDIVEKYGIKRTEEQIDSADIIIFVIDSQTGFCKEDAEILNYLVSKNDLNILTVHNKQDLSSGKNNIEIDRYNTEVNNLYVSAKTGTGINILKSKLSDIALGSLVHSQDNSLTITNERHRISLINTQKSLLKAYEAIEKGNSGEFVAIDLRVSIKHLSEIIGTVSTDDILNNIFSKFCIGK